MARVQASTNDGDRLAVMVECTCIRGHIEEHKRGECPCTTSTADCGVHGKRRPRCLICDLLGRWPHAPAYWVVRWHLRHVAARLPG